MQKKVYNLPYNSPVKRLRNCNVTVIYCNNCNINIIFYAYIFMLKHTKTRTGKAIKHILQLYI